MICKVDQIYVIYTKKNVTIQVLAHNRVFSAVSMRCSYT